MRHRQTVLTLLVVVLLASAGLTAPAQANHDEESNAIDDILSSSDDTGSESWGETVAESVPGTTWFALADGQLERVYRWGLSKSPFTEGETNNESAANFANAFNDRNETLRTAINERANVSTGDDVQAVHFEAGEDPETVYIVGEVNETEGNLTSIEAVNTTDREVDHETVVDGDAAAAADDLTREVADRFADDEGIDQAYQARLIGQYCSMNPWGLGDGSSCDVRSTYWMHEDLLRDSE